MAMLVEDAKGDSLCADYPRYTFFHTVLHAVLEIEECSAQSLCNIYFY